MEVKKVFALASVTVLTGLVSAATAIGCSSTTTIEDPGDAQTDVKNDRGSSGSSSGDGEPTIPEEGTVGKLCAADADCEVPNSVGDNVCSIGFFTIGDIYGDPVCVSQCTRGPGSTFADILCDATDTVAPGVCNASNPGEQGVCLPACEFDSTEVTGKCNGNNGCAAQYFGTNTETKKVFSLGICLGACSTDADCKGTPGSKCQAEIGLCVNPDKLVAYTGVVGAACNGAAAVDECNCNTIGGTSANKDKGYCSHSCQTGAAGDTFCGGKVAGWKCSAGLPVTFTDGAPAFTAQPDGVLGQCALPCTADADCAALDGTLGLTAGTVKCEDTAGFKICVAPSK